MKHIVFVIALLGSLFVSPALALLIGIAYALVFGTTFPQISKKGSKYLLQASVVGLGFGINMYDSLSSSAEGMMMTIVSVSAVLVLGFLLGKRLGLDRQISYLISVGTAICGGSAIAAVSPVVKADEDKTGVAMGVIFALNAVALFLFPPLGHWLGLTEQQFGMWSAIAIHDTSSVVGAGASYGPEALMVATTVKLTRALWIIPVALISSFIFVDRSTKTKRITVPVFILLFIGVVICNTYWSLPEKAISMITILSHKGLSLTLMLIGTTLSFSTIRKVGVKPILFGIALWFFISVIALISIKIM